MLFEARRARRACSRTSAPASDCRWAHTCCRRGCRTPPPRCSGSARGWGRRAARGASRPARRPSAQHRDPVPAALPVPDRRIAERFDRLARERLVGAFELLQADHVGLEFLEPAGQHVQPRVDPVDVVARDSQPPLAAPSPRTTIRRAIPFIGRVRTGLSTNSPTVIRASTRIWLEQPQSSAIVVLCFRARKRKKHGTPATSVAGVYSFMGLSIRVRAPPGPPPPASAASTGPPADICSRSRN